MDRISGTQVLDSIPGRQITCAGLGVRLMTYNSGRRDGSGSVFARGAVCGTASPSTSPMENSATFLHCSRYSLVLKYPNYDAAVRGLVICRFVLLDLATFAHCAWRQHVGQRDMTLLQQGVCDIVSAIFAEFLV